MLYTMPVKPGVRSVYSNNGAPSSLVVQIKPTITKRPKSTKATLFLITIHMITSLISQRAQATYLPLFAENRWKASCSKHHNQVAFLLTTGKTNINNGG